MSDSADKSAGGEQSMDRKQGALSEGDLNQVSEQGKAAAIIQKNTPPSSPYEAAANSLQSSPSKNPSKSTIESTAGEAPQSPMKIAEEEEEDNKANNVASTINDTVEPKEKSVTIVEASADEQQAADTNMPSTIATASSTTIDNATCNQSNEEPSASSDNSVAANVASPAKEASTSEDASKVESSSTDHNSRNQKQSKKPSVPKGASSKDLDENKKSASKDITNRKKERSPLRSRANRRHNVSNGNQSDRGYDHRAGHYGGGRGGNYSGYYNNAGTYSGGYNSGRYNGYQGGGYRPNNHYHRPTVQNNYGLRSPPFKSNFEPSDSARQKADEFVRASVGTI